MLNLSILDNFLNSITMYRLVLYYLIFLLFVAFVLSVFGLMSFSAISLGVSIIILVSISWVTNIIFARIYNVGTNVESVYITALILALIITPAISLKSIEFIGLSALLAIASKYLINIKGKHIFNPAAIGVVLAGFIFNMYASWWIGTAILFPFTLAGIIIVKKIRRFDMVFYFFIFSLISILLLSFIHGNTNPFLIIKNIFIDSPILFFAFIMFTEPLTTPPSSVLQNIYAVIVGILFAPLKLGVIYTTPEIALSIGNVFSYLVSPKEKLILKLTEKNKLTSSIYEYIFENKEKLKFTAGQYMEWTLPHASSDSRGVRRYFTLASSPTEDDIKLGIRFEKDVKGSSFKNKLLTLKIGDEIVASQLAGDFTLPKNASQKLVFIAGGIGITPFRSIIKYLKDTNQKRDIILIYSDKNKNEMVYKEIFDHSPIKVLYWETQKEGYLTKEFITKNIPDFQKRIFYLSGPQNLVKSIESVLFTLKVPKSTVKLDYFPGF
jgi:glycine betaine catabolism B